MADSRDASASAPADEHPSSAKEDGLASRPAEPGRIPARLSILAGYVCFATTCTFMQLTGKDKDTPAWINLTVGWVSLSVVLTGLVLGLYGMATGLRRRSFDTVGIAAIGVLMNLGIIGLTIFVMAMIRAAGR